MDILAIFGDLGLIDRRGQPDLPRKAAAADLPIRDLPWMSGCAQRRLAAFDIPVAISDEHSHRVFWSADLNHINPYVFRASILRM